MKHETVTAPARRRMSGVMRLVHIAAIVGSIAIGTYLIWQSPLPMSFGLTR